MDIDAIIAALGDRYYAAEIQVIERVLRRDDPQLIEEAGLALAIWRRRSPFEKPEDDGRSILCSWAGSPAETRAPRRRWRFWRRSRG